MDSTFCVFVFCYNCKLSKIELQYMYLYGKDCVKKLSFLLTPHLDNLANSVDPDQPASLEAG